MRLLLRLVCVKIMVFNSSIGDGHYTLWGLCAVDSSGNNVNCTKASPAYPFDPSSNFGGSTLPAEFASRSGFFYYMSRFSFAFYLIAVTFAVVAFVTGLLAFCSRLGSAISAIFAFLALFFAVTAASLSTAYIVTARNIFTSNGIAASIGVKAMGFTWGSVGALFLAFFGFCCISVRSKRNGVEKADFAGTPTTTKSRFWRRKEKVPFDSEHTANGSY